jgi:Cd2+/Zn2+-exporting ATPase
MPDTSKRYVVSGVCCSTEEGVLRKALDGALGPRCYDYSLLTSELRVDAPVEEKTIVSAVRRAGFGIRAKTSKVDNRSFWRDHQAAVVFGTACLLALAGGAAEYVDHGDVVARMLLGVAIIVAGWPVAQKAWGALTNRVLDMNVLMSSAVLGALAIDRWVEGAAVILLFSLSLMLESYSVSRTRRAVQSLITLSPQQASVMRNGREVLAAAADVAPGEVVIIRPGERIPLDGMVIDGSSTVNESAITGESVSVPKSLGSAVFAGTLNERGALSVRTTTRFEDTTLARIVHLVEEAEHKRAPVQRFVDRFARVYTPAVLGLAVLVAAVPPLVFGAAFSDWLYRAIVLLVIACPCALVISTPVTIVSALTNAARRGILIKGGKDLETLNTVRVVAFDKTGTLTQGNVRVTDVIPLHGTTDEEILNVVATLEQRSEHHVAAAVLEEAERRGVHWSSEKVAEFEAVPGRGVRGKVNNTPFFAGNRELCSEQGIWNSALEDAVDRLTGEGKTVIVVGTVGRALGIVAMRDTLRPHVRDTIASLHAMGVRRTVMLSGDQEEAAERIARDAGVTTWIAGLMPQEKMRAVEDLSARFGSVAMIGDGVNDAPALARSAVGIAMGGVGSDTALETADVVLMSDNLLRLPHLFGLSKKALRVVRQNIALALSLKAVFMVLSATGYATLWMAVLADDGAALLVIMNGLRLLGYEGKKR